MSDSPTNPVLDLSRPLVLGGTGFIGFNIIHALLDRGLPVRATRRESSIALLLRKLKTVEKVFVELDDPDSLENAMEGCDVVFMAAGHYPRFSVDGDHHLALGVQRVQHAMDAAERAGVRRFVYTSTVTTVGYPPGFSEGRAEREANETDQLETAPDDSVYFRLKLAMEREVLSRAGQGSLEIVVTCPTGCLGEYGYKSGTGFFIVALAAGGLPYLVDGPVNLVYVGDVAHAHVEAAVRGRSGHRYILGAHNVTTGALIRMASEKLGVAPPADEISLEEALERNRAEEEVCAREDRGRPTIPVEFLDMMRFGQPFDSAKARSELRLRQTSLEETVDRTIAWYRANGFLPKA